MKRVYFDKTPILKVHKYIVTIGSYSKRSKSWVTKYRYCMNRAEIRDIKKSLPMGSVMEVFMAKHSYLEAWTK